MTLNFYDVMKKGFCFSSAAVSLIFSCYSNYVNIYYYDEVFTFDDVIKKRSVQVIKISCICTDYKLVYIKADTSCGKKYEILSNGTLYDILLI